MKFTYEELMELASPGGGRFKTASVEDAYSFCRRLALGHYENFPVASILIPKKQRPAVFAIYAFSRIADDIADEHPDKVPAERTALLEQMSLLLEEDSYSPVFVALKDTISQFNLPLEPFRKLLSAFTQDINFLEHASWDDVLDYCSRSANPVGELLLRLFNNYNENTARLSDNICTGLQLINFWQDLSIDLKNGRLYIPRQVLDKYQLNLKDLQDAKKTLNLENCINSILIYTENLYQKGSRLPKILNKLSFRIEIALTYAGGEIILRKLQRLQLNVLRQRPKLEKADYLKMLFKAVKYL